MSSGLSGKKGRTGGKGLKGRCGGVLGGICLAAKQSRIAGNEGDWWAAGLMQQLGNSSGGGCRGENRIK